MHTRRASTSTPQKMLLSKNSSIVNEKNERGWTPLFDAALHCHETVIEMLIKAGADVDVEDMIGHNAGKYCDERMWERILALKKK